MLAASTSPENVRTTDISSRGAAILPKDDSNTRNAQWQVAMMSKVHQGMPPRDRKGEADFILSLANGEKRLARQHVEPVVVRVVASE